MTQPDVDQQPEPTADPRVRPLEDAFYALVLAELTTWLASVSAAVLRPWHLWKQAPSPANLWETVPAWTRAVDTRLIPWLRSQAAPYGFRRFERNENVSLPSLQPFESYVQAHLAQVRNYLVRVPNEVFELIRRELREAVDRNETVDQIAERVARVLNVTGSENWPSRARTIAVTEVNGAVNAGSFSAASAVERDTGRRVLKRWKSVHDPKVRHTHREADGQLRLVSEPFIVGGFPLLYPGDKNGPPEEVINCRCEMETR